MKLIRWLLVLALAVGYFLWPYHATKKFGQAVKERDAATIEKMVDVAAIRESLIELVIEAAVARAEQTRPGSGNAMRAQLLKVTESSAFQKYMEQAMKPEALSKMMASGQTSAKGSESMWRNEKWKSPIEFSVQDLTSEARAIFKFRGLGWKLCGIELPKSQLANFASMAGAR